MLRSRPDTAKASSYFDYFSNYCHPDYPVGHVILLASLAQITLLAGLSNLLPLRVVSRTGTKPAQSWRILLPRLLGWTFPIRVGAVAALLAPLGLALALQLAIAPRRVTICGILFPRRIACIACSSSPSRSC